MDRTHQGPLYKRKGFAMKENKFQADLKKELKSRFPGCIVTKLDSADIQGIPDLELLWIKDDRERNQKFRCMVKQGNCSDLITIVKTIYSYRTLEDFKGTRLNKSDDEVFEIAEKLLNEELGFILDLNTEEIPNYIEQYIA